MAGQIDVPGNAYLGNAEFNSWFDPEATQIVLRAAVPHFVIPLDYANNVSLTQAVFDQIAKHKPQTVITKLFAKAFGPTVAPGTFIYDTNALSYFIHPEFATDTKGIWIDMYNTFDPNYGKSIPYMSNPFPAIATTKRRESYARKQRRRQISQQGHEGPQRFETEKYPLVAFAALL
jgi:purine nucleosidase